jgi:hypothetical protein
MIEPIKRTLKNFKVTRTQLITTKKVATNDRLAENEEQVRKELEDNNFLSQYDHVVSSDVVGIEETYEVEEIK